MIFFIEIEIKIDRMRDIKVDRNECDSASIQSPHIFDRVRK